MKTKSPQSPDPKPSTPGRLYRLTYSNARPDDDPKLFKCRDAIAYEELAASLVELGYKLGTTVHFYPDDERQLTEFPKFQPADLLVLTTRPPLHDQVGIIPPHRKIIHATKTELEGVIFQALAEYLEYCTRKHVELTKRGVACLRSDLAHRWRHVELYEYSGAEILRHFIGPEPVKPQPNHHSSIAFFLRANGLPKVNCDFMASFGMDGYGTLIWNRIIRTRYPEWLTSPRFVMAELVFKKDIPERPLTPEFIDDGQYVEVRLLTSGRS